jgi:hypothetical protein
MAAAQRGTSVTLRQDLIDLVEEIQFEDLNLTAERIAPSISVSERAAEYPVLPREAKMKLYNARRKSDGGYTRIQYDWGSDTYICYEYGVEAVVDNVSKLENARFIDEEEQAANRVYEGLHLARESRVAEALLDTSVFTGATNTSAITNEWDDAANATPKADIDAALSILRGKCAYGKKMFSVILSDDLVDYFFATTEIKNITQYTSYAGLMTAPRDVRVRWMAEYFGVKEVIETSAMFDTSKLSNAASIGKFWSNEYIFVGKLCPPGSKITTEGVVKQLKWSLYSDDYIIEDYEEPSYNRMVYRAREYRGIKVNTDYGVLLTNAKTTVSSSTNI